MPITNALIVPPVQSTLANTPEILYTSPANGLGTVITNLSVSNATSTTQTFILYIVPDGGSPTLPVTPQTSLAANRADTPPEMAGQTIPAGGTLQFESSQAGTLIVTASGRELS